MWDTFHSIKMKEYFSSVSTIGLIPSLSELSKLLQIHFFVSVAIIYVNLTVEISTGHICENYDVRRIINIYDTDFSKFKLYTGNWAEYCSRG